MDLAGVHDGQAILIGAKDIRAVQIEDGKAAKWPANPLPLPEGDRIGGWGFFAAGQSVLPLADGKLLAVDLAKGRIAGRSPDKEALERAPQYLIRWKRSVLSQTGHSVSRFRID